MFTSLLNFIRPTKTARPGIDTTHIQESLGINQEHDSRTALLRRFSGKKKKTLGEDTPSHTYVKDAFDISLEAIYAALTHKTPTLTQASNMPPENTAIQAYQKHIQPKHAQHATPETAPWHDKTEQELKIETAITHIDLLLAHDITHIFVKEGQSYCDALTEAVAYHQQKQG